MTLQLLIDVVTGEWERAMKAHEKRLAAAATAAMKDVADLAKQRGRANIAAGGFGPKWQNALRSTVYPQRGTSIDAAAYIRHKIPYAFVFEEGARISGKPLLWLPLPNVQERYRGKAMTPRFYSQAIGPLHSLRNTKKPLLAGYVTANSNRTRLTVAKLRAGHRAPAARRVSVPVFIGVPIVNVRKHFDLRRTFDAVSAQVPDLLMAHMEG